MQTKLDDTTFCYQLIMTLTKFVIYKALFKIETQGIEDVFASNEKKSHLSAHMMSRTVLLRLKSEQLIANHI